MCEKSVFFIQTTMCDVVVTNHCDGSLDGVHKQRSLGRDILKKTVSFSDLPTTELCQQEPIIDDFIEPTTELCQQEPIINVIEPTNCTYNNNDDKSHRGSIGSQSIPVTGSMSGEDIDRNVCPVTGSMSGEDIDCNVCLDGVDEDVENHLYKRMAWSSRVEYMLSSLGYAVGLGNVWRFPYLCYRNGGGAFFIPYIIMLMFVGIPLYYLEVALGQFASLGPITVWKVSPLFKGVGYAMVSAAFLVGIYYNLIMGWSLFYLFASMQDPLPWTSCGNSWNTPACSEFGVFHNCSTTDVNCTSSNYTMALMNASNNATIQLRSPSEEYFYNHVLEKTDGVDNLGSLRWQLALCLLLAWILVFFCLVKGVKTSGKAVWVTAIFPYLILLALLIVGCTQEGALDGIKFYFTPQWHRLADARVWSDAIVQVFFSLGICFGSLTTLASYNKFQDNCYRATMVICIINCLTSFFAGFVVFVILGYLAHNLNTTVDKVVAEGTGLAFVAYPEIVGKMPASVLCSILFFMMLIMLGLDSQFAIVETIVTAVIDENPSKMKRIWVCLTVCVIMCLFGLVLATQGGEYWLALMDHYVASWAIMIVGLLECLSITWVYGHAQFFKDIQMMIGYQPSTYWKIVWKFVTPGLLLFVIIFSWVDYHPLVVDDYVYPYWANVIGWLMTTLSVIPIFGWFIYSIYKQPGTLKQRLKILTTPAPGWGRDEEMPTYKSIRSALALTLKVTKPFTSISTLFKRGQDSDETSVDSDKLPRKQSAMVDIRGALDIEDVITLNSSEDENKERGNWGSRVEFILSCLGYAVGLGNVWRFPYLCYRNGGGAFFIPYFIMLVICGIPLFFMEVSFGQFASLGPITIWRAVPLFKGIGYGMVFVSFLVGIYYNIIIAYAVFYLFSSMQDPLPWSSCNHTWNTPACTIEGYRCAMLDVHQLINATDCVNYTSSLLSRYMGLNTSQLAAYNLSHTQTLEFINSSLINNTMRPRSASEEYFHIYVTNTPDSMDEMGSIKWELMLCLLLSWIFVFIALIRGIKSAGKVVYFTATFPYLILFALFIRGVTLKGSEEGIRFYLTPQWHRLAEAQVWYEAGVQIFFSLSACWGGIITLSSYNKFHNNCYRDALIVSIGNCLTSIFAGFAIFAVIGVMADSLGTTVDKVVLSDAGLAFIAYPEALSKMPGAPFWAVVFFLMLIMIGIDTQFVIVETVCTAIIDELPRRLHSKRILINAVMCMLMFALGLPLTTSGGIYLLQLMDTYAASFSVLVIGLFECFALSWIYGVDRFANDIKAMIGHEPRMLWKVLWKFICPLMILAILVFSIVDYTPARYGEYVFPFWAEAIGWMMVGATLLLIPGYGAFFIIRTPGSIKERFKLACTPTKEWGPALEVFRYYMSCLPGMPNYGYADSSTADNASIKERNKNLTNLNMGRLAALASSTVQVYGQPSYEEREKSVQWRSNVCIDTISSTKYPALPKVLYVGENDDYILVPKYRSAVTMMDKCVQTDPTDEDGESGGHVISCRDTSDGNEPSCSSPNSSLCEDTSQDIHTYSSNISPLDRESVSCSGDSHSSSNSQSPNSSQVSVEVHKSIFTIDVPPEDTASELPLAECYEPQPSIEGNVDNCNNYEMSCL